MRGLCPDAYLGGYDEVTPDFLRARGIRFLILDIDNTLAPYEQPEPDEGILRWFSDLAASGVRCAFVSNNDLERVSRFNRAIGIPMFPNGRKPLRKYMRRAMDAIGAGRRETAILGDQIFTDVLAGRLVGIRAILVPPIRDKRDFLTRFKRVLEKPILRHYKNKEKKEGRA